MRRRERKTGWYQQDLVVNNKRLSFSLRLFQKFDTFRILVCGGDGSVGWVLSEIDALTLHKQVQTIEMHKDGQRVVTSPTEQESS